MKRKVITMLRLGFSINPATAHRAPEFKAAGIDEAELSLFDTRDSVEAALKAGGAVYDALTAAGIGVWSVHLPTGDIWEIGLWDEERRVSNIRQQQHIIRAAADWGARVAVVHGLGWDYSPENAPKNIDACRRSLDELSSFAARQGIRVAVENLPRTPLETSEYNLRLMDCCAGLCFDVNHLLLQSHDEFMDDIEKYVITTHLSDYDRGGPLGERHWKPGEAGGVVPWARLCRRLLDVGYRGPWMFEVDMNGDKKYTADEVVRDFTRLSGLA